MKKIQKLVIWVKRNIYYFLFVLFVFSFCLILLVDKSISNKQLSLSFFVDKDSAETRKTITETASLRNPSNFLLTMNPYVMPAGTQMMIPPWVLEQYQLSEQQALYGDVLNFLIYNYSVAAPSVDDSDVDTYYIPLTVYDSDYGSDYDDDYDDDYSGYGGDYDGGTDIARGTVMVDVTKLQIQQPDSQVTPEGSPQVTPEGSPQVTPEGSPQVTPEGSPQVTSEDSPQVTSEAQQPDLSVVVLQAQPDSILITTEDIDTSKSPPVSAQKPEEGLTETYPATCDKAEKETEASGPCVDCVGLNKEQTNSFLNEVSKSVRNFANKRFSTIPAEFCENCHGVDVGEFFRHIEQRANEEKVPAGIMFTFILRESNGNCDIKSGGDEKSFGLFQLNTENSTKLKPCAHNELSGLSTQQMADVCKKGQYRREGYPKAKGRCLNNPYCNFEEAIHLFNEKWDRPKVNKGVDRPTETDWMEMGKEGRNLWRNAIIAYNGDYYLGEAEKEMKKEGVSSHLDNWEVKRMFFVRRYLYNKSKYSSCGTSNSQVDRRCRARYRPQNIVHSLAYVERITGRETEDGLMNSSMCQWVQFKNSNPDLSCKK